jgi:hypothetical protein
VSNSLPTPDSRPDVRDKEAVGSAKSAEIASARQPAHEGEQKMMELSPPHSPIHTKRDFFVHMLTIILGIMIALGLEAIIEWGHHRALVREARQNILTEVRKNKTTVNQTLAEMKQREEELNHIVTLARQLELNPSSFKSGTMTVDWTSHELYGTAWKTASTSGAATYMKYDELQHYTDIYDDQQEFASLQQEGFSMISQLFPLIEATMAHRHAKSVPRERFVQIQQDAYRGVLIAQALESVGQELDKYYATILNQK